MKKEQKLEVKLKESCSFPYMGYYTSLVSMIKYATAQNPNIPQNYYSQILNNNIKMAIFVDLLFKEYIKKYDKKEACSYFQTFDKWYKEEASSYGIDNIEDYIKIKITSSDVLPLQDELFKESITIFMKNACSSSFDWYKFRKIRGTRLDTLVNRMDDVDMKTLEALYNKLLIEESVGGSSKNKKMII